MVRWSADQCCLEFLARPAQVEARAAPSAAAQRLHAPWPCRYRTLAPPICVRWAPASRSNGCQGGTRARNRPGCLRRAVSSGPLAGAERRRRPLLAGPADARESAILALAWRELGHVSAERLLSGSGLPLLHRLVAVVDGRREEPLSTAEIVAVPVPAGRPVPGSDRNILRDARLDGRKSCADTRRPGWRLCRRWYHSKAGGTV
jgi:hypothetical protein